MAFSGIGAAHFRTTPAPFSSIYLSRGYHTKLVNHYPFLSIRIPSKCLCLSQAYSLLLFQQAYFSPGHFWIFATLFILSGMALSIVKELHQQYIQSLLKEGIVNDQFRRILNLKTVEGSDCVVQLINTYFTDMEKLLLETKSSIGFPEVDFCNLEALAREMEDRSSFIGAENVRHACVDLILASREMSKKNFERAVSWVDVEFGIAQNRLEAVVQMERKIIRLETKQK